MRRFLISCVIAIAVLGALYWWGVQDGRLGGDSRYHLDLAELRQLADSMPGPKPVKIKYENVATFRFFAGMITAGDGWSGSPMQVYSYQLLYPDHTAIIDAAFDRSSAPPDFITKMYDGAAYGRVLDALAKASLIVVTHEHMDHIGGIMQNPAVAALLDTVRLTDKQLAHPERMRPVKIPKDVFTNYKPLHYDRVTAIAPGMVLIDAPGHTPGSQMVFVKLADGRELLFLGDVVWHMRNIDVQKERPRWVTALLVQEDRDQVSNEIRALRELRDQDPTVALIPGHDGDVIGRMTAAGFMEKGFVP